MAAWFAAVQVDRSRMIRNDVWIKDPAFSPAISRIWSYRGFAHSLINESMRQYAACGILPHRGIDGCPPCLIFKPDNPLGREMMVRQVARQLGRLYQFATDTNYLVIWRRVMLTLFSRALFICTRTCLYLLRVLTYTPYRYIVKSYRIRNYLTWCFCSCRHFHET